MTRALAVATALASGLAVAGIVPVPAAAQVAAPTASSVRFSTGSTPDTVTVGDRFRALIRVSSVPGARVEFAPSVAGSDSVQQTDSARVVVGDDGEWTVAYPLVAWRAGPLSLPAVPVRVAFTDGAEQRFEVDLRLPMVRSVLPADTTNLEPRGAKSIIVGRWNRQLLVLALIGVALLLAGLGILWRRLRRRPAARTPVAAAPASPREEALAELERARALPVTTPAERKRFYSAVSDAVRRYLSVLSPRWGPELTTAELASRLEAGGVGWDAKEALASLLDEADLVKFARHPVTPEDAMRAWDRACDWVLGYPPAAVPAQVGAGDNPAAWEAR